MRYLLVLLTLLIVASCNKEDNGTACTLEAVYGLGVTVRHSENNAVLKEGITVTATDGTYVEELQTSEFLDNFFGAAERPGTYVITVEGEGFQSRISNPVVVASDECHVITEFLEFTLQPL